MISASEAHDQLVRSTERFVDFCAQLPEPAWTTRSERAIWSPSEVIEHVSIANGVMAAVFDRIAERPLDASRTPALADEEIPFVLYGGGDEPPGAATPTGTWTDPGAAYDRLRRSTTDLCERSAVPNVDLREVGVRHPAFGILDGVQWLLFAFAHTERHRGDIRHALRALATE